MECNKDNFCAWAREGIKIVIEFSYPKKKIKRAKLAISYGFWGICQNSFGIEVSGKIYGYNYFFPIYDLSKNKELMNFQQILTIRPAKVSHTRKHSLDSKIEGSCTLPSKWKWLSCNSKEEWYLFTHKPKKDQDEYGYFVDFYALKGESERVYNTIKLPNEEDYDDTERLWRRQGNGWVNVG